MPDKIKPQGCLKEILQSKYSRFFIAGLLLNILCSWFSSGFHQADEHYQILEFCNYKLGFIPGASLPWEFQDQVRATLLPDIAYGFARIMQWCGVYNPFFLAFLLRFITGIASWFIVSKWCILMIDKFKTETARKAFLLMSFFLWFIPYLSVRFTAENISGILFLYGLWYILNLLEKPAEKPYMVYIVAGLLFGISFFIRFQMMFAIGGFLLWLLIIKKVKWKFIFLVASAIVVAIGLNIWLDYWFYGNLVFTPYKYYYANIVLHKAASFGVNPWWYFIEQFIMQAAPPISVFLLIMFIAGVYKNPRNPVIWILIAFILPHFFIGHKEMRFLFPVTIIFIYSCAIGLDYLINRFQIDKLYKYAFKISVIVSIPLLLFRTFVPAETPIDYCKYLYYNVPEKDNVLFVLKSDCDMTIDGLFVGFYKSRNIKIVKIDSLPQMQGYLSENNMNSALLFYKQNNDWENHINGLKAELAYCYFPNWILKFNFNHWVERSTVWKFYRISKA